MCNFKWMALQGIVFFLEYKLIQRHVDSNQNQHDHFYLEINIIVVIQCIGREQDGPSHTRQENAIQVTGKTFLLKESTSSSRPNNPNILKST